MTYLTLLRKLDGMTQKQLGQKVRLFEGCSGNFTTITSVEIAPDSIYRDEEAPGERRHRELKEIGCTPKPVLRKGEVYFIHDH